MRFQSSGETICYELFSTIARIFLEGLHRAEIGVFDKMHAKRSLVHGLGNLLGQKSTDAERKV